jgi:YegS/Rv2252/BmrU family lipid kinase
MITSSTHIIVNPKSGNGRGKKVGELLALKLKNDSAAGIKLVVTKHANEATMLTRLAISDGAGLIIAVGGDGTIHEVINGFFNNGKVINEDCHLGIINCGTGAGLAGTMKLPESIEDQLLIALGNKTKWIDIGMIQYTDEQGESVKRHFISECQTGIGGKVASSVGPFLKHFGGTLGFGISALFQAVTMKARKVEVVMDEKMEYSGRLIGLVVGNGSECAGGMKLTPGAKTDDGKLDLLLIHNMNMLQRLVSLKKVYTGSHIYTPNFSLKRAGKIEVTTSFPWPLEVDGEVIGSIGERTLKVHVIPKALKIKVP